MPSKKKKYNARFPAGRIKKIMQTDEEVGKVAQAVPVIISRTLELFVESLLTKSMQITQSRNAKTLTPSHMKQCILSENRFDFLKDLVKNIPDASTQEDNENNALFEEEAKPEALNLSKPNLYTEEQSSSSRTPVIQYAPNFAAKKEDDLRLLPVPPLVPRVGPAASDTPAPEPVPPLDDIPPLVPISQHYSEDSLCIDEDYDN